MSRPSNEDVRDGKKIVGSPKISAIDGRICIDAQHDGGKWDKIEDVRDRQEDIRDRQEDRRDRNEDVRDRA